jgi:hypothetical protein
LPSGSRNHLVRLAQGRQGDGRWSSFDPESGPSPTPSKEIAAAGTKREKLNADRSLDANPAWRSQEHEHSMVGRRKHSEVVLRRDPGVSKNADRRGGVRAWAAPREQRRESAEAGPGRGDRGSRLPQLTGRPSDARPRTAALSMTLEPIHREPTPRFRRAASSMAPIQRTYSASGRQQRQGSQGHEPPSNGPGHSPFSTHPSSCTASLSRNHPSRPGLS